MVNKQMTICPRCGQETSMIPVHGHYQCVICMSIVDDCCNGLTCQQMQQPKEERTNEETKRDMG
jgi:hypothetical protein